jgi:TolA-binding protein
MCRTLGRAILFFSVLRGILVPSLCLLALLCLSACSSGGKRISLLSSEMEQLQRQVQALEKDQVASFSRKREILGELRELVQTEAPTISNRTKIAEQRIASSPLPPEDRVAPQPQTDAPAVILKPTSSNDAAQLFRSSYGLYNSGNYREAAEGFAQAYQYADTPDLKVGCLFGLGESRYRLEEWQAAIDVFSFLEGTYPNHPIISNAMLKMGYSYLQVGNQTYGIQTLQRLTERFPATEEARLAKEWLSKLKPES